MSSFSTFQSVPIQCKQRFSQSPLWRLQLDFFTNEGMQAWNAGKVPQYATSNPFIAAAYSKAVVGFLRNYERHSINDGDISQPIYIVELGAGSGRFSYHFLKHFFEQIILIPLDQLLVRYVITDIAQKNIDFWQTHPQLQPFIQQGLLDFAKFDAGSDRTLTLVHSGETLTPETLKNPMVAIANYFFDSIPQDLFYIENNQLYETLVSFHTSKESDNNEHNPLENLDINYTNQETTSNHYYKNSAFNDLLNAYQNCLDSSYLLFPKAALDCIEQLRQLSGDRLLLLSADKGYSREESLQNRSRPTFAQHSGGISLMVNFDAIARYTRNQGGEALLPSYLPRSLTICAFLFGLKEQDYPETRHAYHAAIDQLSPDDFFTLKKIIEPHFDTLSLKQILAYLRLSQWDHKIFLGCFDNLLRQVETAQKSLLQEVYRAIQNVWQTYYFIGESKDLPFSCSMLLYKMEYYAEAIVYLDRSLQLYGDDPGIFYNQAMCYAQLSCLEAVQLALDKALALYPQFEAAQALKAQLENEFLDPAGKND